MGYNLFAGVSCCLKGKSLPELIKDNLSSIIAAMLGLSIAISTAGMSGCSIVFIIIALFSPGFKRNLQLALQNKFVLLALMFYLFIILGVSWSDAPYTDSLNMLLRLVGYGLAPSYFIVLSQKNASKYLLDYFVYGELLTAGLSILAWLFNHPIFMGKTDTVFYWAVFRGHLLHDAFLAVASNFILMRLFDSGFSIKRRFAWFMVFILVSFDILFLVQGRTGQVMWCVSNLFLLVYYLGKKGLLLAFGLILIVAPFLINYAPAVKEGIRSYQNDQYQLAKGNSDTSTGLRQEFHANSLIMFKQSPLIGHGTGSYPSHYRALISGSKMTANTQPHGDVYLILVEFGVIGLLIFWAMLWFNLRELFNLKNNLLAGIGIALLLSYLIALTQNSFFSDNVSGLTYIFLMLAILIKGSQVKV